MRYDSIFDVIGHIMVGPSSSHTAGACRIGLVVHKLLGGVPTKAEIYLHGSFAATHKGHGTDIAIVAGLLGIRPDDERLRQAFSIAQEQKMKFKISTVDLGVNYHPNTTKIVAYLGNDKITVVGSSVGGGNIVIEEIDGLTAGFNGDNPTLVSIHEDKMGILAKLTDVIAKNNLNIETMHLSRDIQTKIALCYIELNKPIDEEFLDKIKQINGIKKARFLYV